MKIELFRARTMTLAKAMYEDENPIINAWIGTEFEDGRGVVKCPLTVRPATWITENYKTRIRWEMETWVPMTPCTIFYLLVFFVDHNDYASKYLFLKAAAGQHLNFSYEISDESS